MKRFLSILLLCCAAARSELSIASLHLGLSTEFPIFAGARIEYRPLATAPVSFSAQAGLLPVPYVNAIYSTGLITGSQTLWDDLLGNSFVASAAVTYQPFRGFFADLQYVFLSGGGQTSLGSILSSELGSSSSFFSSKTITITGMIHSLALHAGYLFQLNPWLDCRVALGLTKPLTGSFAFSGASSSLNSSLQTYANQALGAIWVPSLTVAFLFGVQSDEATPAKQSPKEPRTGPVLLDDATEEELPELPDNTLPVKSRRAPPRSR